jgi:hypothetical protein
MGLDMSNVTMKENEAACRCLASAQLVTYDKKAGRFYPYRPFCFFANYYL